MENTTCGPVIIGFTRSSIWQQSVDGTPYLWCSLGRTTVGRKLFLDIAGQNLTFSEGGVARNLFFEILWQGSLIITSSGLMCYESAHRHRRRAGEVGNNDENAEEAARCTGFYDSETEISKVRADLWWFGRARTNM